MVVVSVTDVCKSIGAVMRTIMLSVILLVLALPGSAQEINIDPAELAIFIDGVIAEQIIAYEIPGVSVSIVHDGKLIFSKGYGYADMERLIPVSPDSTLFRIGSVSKLFVWTSVMQLMEQGKLDLHADVNTYLDGFEIPQTFEKPITLAHLLTHTPGFEEQELGVFVMDSSDIAPLGEYLANNMPARVRPPGELSSYSNYGTALAAYIVQQVSGLPFYQYVELNILEPLDMNRSSFVQPPPGQDGRVATGYVTGGGVTAAQPFEWVQAYPAGSMCSTADEMANFMIAHLNNGRFHDTRILGEATAIGMHSPHFQLDSRVNGWTWGFMQLNMGPDSLIWHGGDTYYFHSALFLMPSQDIGIFATYNCPSGAKARIDLVKAFLAHYSPLPPQSAPIPHEGPGNANRCAGAWLDIRTNLTTPERLMTLLNPTNVIETSDHSLQFAGNLWVETEPLIFRNTTSPEVLLFRENAEGGITTMIRGNNPTTAYLKLAWTDTPAFHRNAIIVCLLLFASIVLLWPIAFIVLLRKKNRKSSKGAKLTGIFVWIVSLLNILFILILKRMITPMGFGFGVPAGMNTLLKLTLLQPLMAAVLAVMLIIAWKNRYWTTIARLHYTLIAAASIFMVWWLNYWNLLGYSFS